MGQRCEEIEMTTQTQQPSSSNEGNEDRSQSCKKSISFKLSFVGLALILMVFQVDASCLSIALPAISGDLSGSSLESFWANLAYSLCGLVMQPVWANFSHVFGRNYPIYICTLLLFTGSILFSIAKDMNGLIAGRVLQGLGGGGIDVLSSIVLADMTTLEERSRYLGFMAIPSAVGNIAGPFIGALLSTYASWRWIGWMNLPLLGVGLILVLFFLKLRSIPLDATFGSNFHRLDLIGLGLFVTGATLFCVPISWAGSLFPWASWQTLLPLSLGIAFIIVFTLYEAIPVAPIIPRRIFQSRTGNLAYLGGFLHGIVLISLLQYLTLFYQAVQRQTSISSAIFLLPTVVTSVAVAAVSMIMVPFFGGYLWLLRIAWLITTLGTGLLSLFTVKSSTSLLFGLPILWGQGVSLLRLILLPVQASVQHVDDQAMATSTFITIRMFGALIGLAISSPIFNSEFSRAITEAEFMPVGELKPLENASNAIKFIGELRLLETPVALRDAISEVYLGSFKAIFYTMTGISGFGLITSIFLDEISLKRREFGNQRFEG